MPSDGLQAAQFSKRLWVRHALQFQCLGSIVLVTTAAGVLLTSGCATVFVRSPGAVTPEHVFPATVFDAQMFWEAGVKGQPLFTTVDGDAKNSPFARVAFGLGAILDAPFSIAFDTILLPVDLIRAKRGGEQKDVNREKGAVADRGVDALQTSRTPTR